MLLLNSLRILCFGDSLTQGWSGSTMNIHPYSINLESSLETAFPSINISTDNQGIGGDQTECPPGVCPGFLPRMEKLYENTTNSYDWAVILGGTNDLVWSRTATEIYTSLKKIWSIPLSNGTKVLALTVPECGGCNAQVDASKKELNAMIMNHTAENFYTFNLHDSIPYKSMPEKQRKVIWDDVIHFTPKGYDLVGKRIAERMEEILKGQDSGVPDQEAMREDL